MADRAFRQLLLLCLAVSLPLGAALAVTLAPSAFERAMHGSDAFVQTCLAALYGIGRQLPPIGVVVLAVAAAAGASGAGRAAALVVRTRAVTSRWVFLGLTPSLALIAERLGLGGRVALFACASPLAFTAGLLRPRIYLSTGALAALGADELEAVLLHERAHLLRRDPLRVTVARAAASALFFVPLADALLRRYEVAKELDADRDVLAAQRRVGPVAGALERLSRAGVLDRPPAAIGAWSSASARIAQLEGADLETLLPAAPPRAGVLSALAIALLLALALGQAFRANIVPSAAWELAGATRGKAVYACPVPIEGPLL